MAANDIMVFIELTDAKPESVSEELISEAKRLTLSTSGKVLAVACGYKIDKNKLKSLGKFGLDTVYYLENKELSHFRSIPYANAVSKIILEKKPKAVLFGATPMGRDLAPRIAAKIRCGLTADSIKLSIGTHEMNGKKYEQVLLQERPAFGGNIVATIVAPDSLLSMSTVREGVCKLEVLDENALAQIEEIKVDISEDETLTSILEIVRKEKAVNLKDAKIIVCAGMGAATEETMTKIKELAHVLGASLAGTRPLIDAGYLSADHQVGQTGSTVRPNLFVSCGVSGQIQHISGMSESMRIVAINIDEEAPIFNIAHYSIVGDLNLVIPKMIRAYKNRV